MIYSAKAYLEAGDGNLLGAEVALKAEAHCAGTEGGKRNGKEEGGQREESRVGQRSKEERKRGYTKGTSFLHILYPVWRLIKVCKDVPRNLDLSRRFRQRVVAVWNSSRAAYAEITRRVHGEIARFPSRALAIRDSQVRCCRETNRLLRRQCYASS